MTTTQYIVMDTETGGRDSSKVSLLTASFNIVDLTELRKKEITTSRGSLNLWLKPNDGLYVIEAKALEVNKIDLVSHEAIAQPYSIGKNTLLRFLDSHSKWEESKPQTKVYSGSESAPPRKRIKFVALGWNVEYDINMIKNNLLTKEEFDTYFGYSSFDVKTIAMQNKALGLLPDELYLSLPSVAEHFGINTSNSHNAVEDCRITLRVLECLVDQQTNRKTLK